jgi:hypothetical protein
MALPFDTDTNKYDFVLERHALSAIYSLPPPCDATQMNCTAWWESNAKYFRKFHDSYGTSVVVEGTIGGRVEQSSEWDAHLAATADGEKKLTADANIDLAAATGLPGTTGTHDPNVKNNALVCVGGNSTACTKAGISPGVNGAYAKSIDTSHKLLQYKLVPISELLDGYEISLKQAVEQSTQHYIQEQQQKWNSYYSKYQQCVAPFECPHCPLSSNCHPPCSGSSVSLGWHDCNAWQYFTRNPLYTTWAEAKCGTKVHTDPCSCKFYYQTQCANGHITYIDMGNQGLPGSGGIPLALLDLTGLTHLSLAINFLQGSIPSAIGQLQQLTYLNLDANSLQGSIPSAIGQLQQLTVLFLGTNSFTGTVPQELTTLKHLNAIGLDTNPHLTGKLPAFDFSQFTQCCTMFGDPFTCPFPAGANTCVGGPGCYSGKPQPPPTCK